VSSPLEVPAEVPRAPSARSDEYRRIIDSLGAVLWEADAATFQFTYVSQGAVDILDYALDEWLAPGFWRAHTHPDDVDWATAFCLDSTRAGRDHQFEYRMVRRDGSIVWIHDVVTLRIEGDGSRALRGIMIDITERKRTAQRLREVEAQLREAHKMEAIGRLAGGIAHDFNNLLTVISSFADFAISAGAADDPRTKDVMEIRRAADRAALLTQQLLAFSRKQVLRARVVDVNADMRDLHTMLDRLIGEDVVLELVLDPDAGAILVDPGQLQQVILNLAVNARDAMPSGGRLTIATGQVNIAPDEVARRAGIEPGRYVKITVRDTGVGMAPEVLARCFEPFFTTKEAGKGTGLGLSTVYGVVTQSRGHLRAESTPGEGTSFEILFRRVGSPPAVPVEVERRQPAQRERVVLVVEDNDLVRKLAERVLKGAGYHVIAVANGADALDVASQQPGAIQLVVTDVMMPGISGPAFVRELDALVPGTRVLYMSGYTSDEMTIHGIDEERVNFLPKPFTADQLLRRVREALESDID
jgi:two-component system, cell cycle sensor histidine kinase and response regulator CckA